MKVTDYIADVIERNQVKEVFVGNGGCIIHLLDSLNKRVKLVPCHNEQSAAIAAEAYARCTQGFGVAVATSGPGFVNLIQGIACAYYDSIPVLFLVGAPPMSQLKAGLTGPRQRGFQEMPVLNMVDNITKYAVMAHADTIHSCMETALYYMMSGRKGPALIQIPDNVQYAECNGAYSYKEPAKDNTFSTHSVDEWILAYSRAKRPMIVVGGGIRSDTSAVWNLNKLLEYTNIPFVSTWASQDLFREDTPSWLGSFGVSSNYPANIAIQKADLLLVLGCKLDTHQVGANHKTFAPEAEIYAVDIDMSELNKNDYEKFTKIKGDVSAVLDYINEYRLPKVNNAWSVECEVLKHRFPICKQEYFSEIYINPYVFMKQLSELTGIGDTIITDAGATLTWTMQGYITKVPQRVFSSFNHSPMGYAIPASIGAHYALRSQSNIICISGDGGLMMNLQELATIGLNRLPIKIFVLNNEGYGIIRQTQDTWMQGREVCAGPKSGLKFPHLRGIAEAFEIPHYCLAGNRSPDIINQVLQEEGPVFCEVLINPRQRIIPKLEFGKSIDKLSPEVEI